MPKETFKDWKTGERTLFELRWAKQTDVDPAKAVMYFPPLPKETPDGVFEMIGNDGDVTQIDRLIEALRRAKRALLGTTTGVDAVVDSLSDAESSAARVVSDLNSELNAKGDLGDEDFMRSSKAHSALEQVREQRSPHASVDPAGAWAEKDRLQSVVAEEIEVDRLKSLKTHSWDEVEHHFAGRFSEAGVIISGTMLHSAVSTYFELVNGYPKK